MYLLFDIGGTNMRLALAQNREEFDKPEIIPTPKDFEEGMALFKKCIGERNIDATAGGIAGALDRGKTVLVSSPNLPGWVQKPLKDELEKLTSAPVYVENDTAVVGLGEASAGAGKGYEILVYITVSTGVGGVRIIDGRIDKNAMGFEPGHQIIFAQGETCSCGAKGHLEAYISGWALERRFHKKAQDIDDAMVWEEEAKILAYALNNVIVFWSPDVIILGGSLMEKISIDRARFYVRKILTIFPTPPPIEKAALGDIGGLYGALILLNQQEKGDRL